MLCEKSSEGLSFLTCRMGSHRAVSGAKEKVNAKGHRLSRSAAGCCFPSSARVSAYPLILPSSPPSLLTQDSSREDGKIWHSEAMSSVCGDQICRFFPTIWVTIIISQALNRPAPRLSKVAPFGIPDLSDLPDPFLLFFKCLFIPCCLGLDFPRLLIYPLLHSPCFSLSSSEWWHGSLSAGPDNQRPVFSPWCSSLPILLCFMDTQSLPGTLVDAGDKLCHGQTWYLLPHSSISLYKLWELGWVLGFASVSFLPGLSLIPRHSLSCDFLWLSSWLKPKCHRLEAEILVAAQGQSDSASICPVTIKYHSPKMNWCLFSV